MSLIIPESSRVPKVGYYAHYKHNPEGKLGNYMYYVPGIGFHTEEPGVLFVNYLPLYPEASVYQATVKLGIVCFDDRPLEMWMGSVTVAGTVRPRFEFVTDEAKIAKLKVLHLELYDHIGRSH